MAEWTREERDRLGRPLTKFDLCPKCGKTPSEHSYRADTDGLACIDTARAFKSYVEYRRALDQQKQDEERQARLQRAQDSRYSYSIEYVDEWPNGPPRRRGAGATKNTPIVDPPAGRRYFDEG